MIQAARYVFSLDPAPHVETGCVSVQPGCTTGQLRECTEGKMHEMCSKHHGVWSAVRVSASPGEISIFSLHLRALTFT